MLFTVAMLVASAQNRVIDAIRPRLEFVRSSGGVVLVAVGLWFVALAIWADRFSGVFPV